MIWVILSLLFFIFTPKVLADGVSVSWKSIPSSASYDTQFDLQVKVTGVAKTTYYLRADDGTDCTFKQLNISNNDWLKSCDIGVSEMQSITLGDDGTGENILRLKEISSSGSKTLYSYVYDSDRNLLATSSSGSITINAITPTPTITSTPTPTPTSAITPTPTPTKVLTPTPTEAPIIEPTQAPITTIVSTNKIDKEDNKTEKSGKNYLPIVFIIFGLLMFAVPFLGPKIAAKIRFKKREKPPMIPPFTGLTDQPLQ